MLCIYVIAVLGAIGFYSIKRRGNKFLSREGGPFLADIIILICIFIIIFIIIISFFCLHLLFRKTICFFCFHLLFDWHHFFRTATKLSRL